MDKLSPMVQEAFGIHSRRIRKEKGRFICETPNGLMSIYISNESTDAIRIRYAVKEQLAENGFPWTNQYQATATGQPYIIVGRETYVMTPHPYTRDETDFGNEADVVQAFEYLARFHIAARGLPPGLPCAPPMSEIYARNMNEFMQAGKQARRGSRMSDFDVSFIKHSAKYHEIMLNSAQGLAKTNYAELYTQAVTQCTVCHNCLKEENLPTVGGITYLTNLSEAAFDLQLTDLAALIRRYAQRSLREIPIKRLIEIYDATYPLPDGAYEILHSLLIFPWAFMKIISQYYSKKRNWTPVGIISRMETVLAERESYELYVNDM